MSSLHEQGQRSSYDGKAESILLVGGIGLQAWPSGGLRRIIAAACLGLLCGIHKRVACDCAGPAIRARGRDELYAADLAAPRRVGGQEGAALGVGRGQDFASGGREPRCGCDDRGTAGRVGRGHDDGWAVFR